MHKGLSLLLLATTLCAGASLEHRMFKTNAPQQSSKAQTGDDCSASWDTRWDTRNQPSQIAAKPQVRTRQIRKQRASQARHSSFTTQYNYTPVPSGM